MNTIYDDNDQMEYLRQQRLKKEQKIKRRNERHCSLREKMKFIFSGCQKRTRS